MTKKATVVVGYDGSAEADLALDWGRSLSVLEDAPLDVVVVAMAPTGLPPSSRKHESDRAHLIAERARAILEHDPAVRATVTVEHGWTLPVLLGHGQEARLLVVGARGHGRLESFWLGSTSQHLAAHAACPVAVVRAQHDPGAREILVGIDGSPASVRALAAAAERAERSGETVLAVHAYPVLSAFGGGIGALAEDIDTGRSDAAERLAAELVAGVAVDHPDVKLRSTAVMGHPAEVLARLSEDASLVVLGSRGRTPVQELVLGSVSQETLRRACCPVLVVR